MHSEYSDIYFVFSAAICECYKEKKNPTDSDVIHKFFDLVENHDEIFINSRDYDLKYLRVPERPKCRDEIRQFNVIHSYISFWTKYIKQNEPDFETSGLSEVNYVFLVKPEGKKNNSTKVYFRQPEYLTPVFIQGLASKSSSLYKFRKSNMYDSNINRIICGFLGEKPKKIADDFYVFNQCLEFGIKFPQVREKLIDALLTYIILARSQ